MNIPASEHFKTIPLDAIYNVGRRHLPAALTPPEHLAETFGSTQFRGMPFDLGAEGTNNVVLLNDKQVIIETGGVKATYFLFLHVAEDITTNYKEGLADYQQDGNELGSVVSNYCILYEDGGREPLPILRRFAIQQSRIQWGASAFASVPAT